MSVVTVPSYEVCNCDICGRRCNEYNGVATGEMIFTRTDEHGFGEPLKPVRIDICMDCLKPHGMSHIHRGQS